MPTHLSPTLLASLAALLLGAVMFLAGRRGRRINDHPSCRRCGYDLLGLPPTSTRCPECGHDLSRRRARRNGVRTPLTPLYMAGGVLLPMGAAIAGAQGWRLFRAFYLTDTARKPAWVLLVNLNSRNADTRTAARGELLTRWISNALSAGDADRLGHVLIRDLRGTDVAARDLALAQVNLADAAGVLRPGLADAATDVISSTYADPRRRPGTPRGSAAFLEARHLSGQLPPEHWRRYQSIWVPTLAARPTVGLSEPVFIRIHDPFRRLVTNRGRTGPALTRCQPVAVTIAGHTLDASHLRHSRLHTGNVIDLPPTLVALLADGQQSLTVAFEVGVTFNPKTPLVTTRVEQHVDFELLPAPTSVKLVQPAPT